MNSKHYKIAGIMCYVLIIVTVTACLSCAGVRSGSNSETRGNNVRIVFLHHSTGRCIWQGGVPRWFARYNSENNTNYSIEKRAFPEKHPYGWRNYPFDYWNIWVNNAGEEPFMEEPTLEILTREFNVVMFKHCFPVSNIRRDTGTPDIASGEKRTENYKLQYEALKTKMHEFPQCTFIVWTGAALVENATSDENAIRAREFFKWVRENWDEKGDNIFIWDFFELETAGGIYMKEEYAKSRRDPHPNRSFSRTAAPLLCRRITDVIEGRGDQSSLTGR